MDPEERLLSAPESKSLRAAAEQHPIETAAASSAGLMAWVKSHLDDGEGSAAR